MPPLTSLLPGDLPGVLTAIAALVGAVILFRKRWLPALLIAGAGLFWLISEVFSLGFIAFDGFLHGRMPTSQVQTTETVYFLLMSLAFAIGIALLLAAILIALRRRPS